MCDFFKTYADKLHHGKEEDILFMKMKKKKLSKEHSKILSNLIKDHAFARIKVKELRNANDSKKAAELMGILIKLYPEHIRIEDKEFFYPAMSYFSDKENDLMHKECIKFDQEFIHKHYGGVIKEIK